MKINHHKKSHQYASQLSKTIPSPSVSSGYNPYDYIVQQSKYFQVTIEDREIFQEILSKSPFTRYHEWYEKFVPSVNELTQSQREAFIMVYDNFLQVYHKIEKAFPKTKFSIALSGGAVRDMLFLENAPIKDLDFCIDLEKFKRFNYSQKSNKNTPKSVFAEDSEDYTPDYRNEPNFRELHALLESKKGQYSASEYQTILESLEHTCLLKYKFKLSGQQVDAVYWGLGNVEKQQNIGWDEYCNDFLEATIKTTGTNGIPVDLLFSTGGVEEIINSFDFCICQSSISVLKDKMPTLYTDDEKIDFIYQNLIVPIHTLKDLHENKCTIVKRYKNNPEKITYFVFTHFPRIKKKFPNLKLRLYYHYENSDAEQNFNKINQRKLLDEVLASHPDCLQDDTVDLFKI